MGGGGKCGSQAQYSLLHRPFKHQKGTTSQVFQFATARTVATHCITSHERDTTKETNRMAKRWTYQINQNQERRKDSSLDPIVGQDNAYYHYY